MPKIKDIIGEEAFKKLQEIFGGQMKYIPKGESKENVHNKHIQILKRNEELVKNGENRNARIIILSVEFPQYSKGYIDHII